MKLYKVTYKDEEDYSWYVYIIAKNAHEADQTFRHYRKYTSSVTIEELNCASAVLKTHKCVLFDEQYNGIGNGRT